MWRMKHQSAAVNAIVEPTATKLPAWDLRVVSTDNCNTFAALGTGLPNVQVKDLYLLPADGDSPAVLRAGTYGRGVWEIIV